MNKQAQFEAVLLLAMKSLEIALRQIDKAFGENHAESILHPLTLALRSRFLKWHAAGGVECYEQQVPHPESPTLGFTARLELGDQVCGVSFLFWGSDKMREIVHCTHEMLWRGLPHEDFDCLGLTEAQLATFQELREHCCEEDAPAHTAPVKTYWY